MIERDMRGDSNLTESKGIHVHPSECLTRSLWLRWILATILGVTGGSTAFQILRQMGFSFAWLVGLGIFGLVIGLAQSAVLEQVACKPGGMARTSFQWMLTCLMGWIAGGVAGFIVPVAMWLFLMVTIGADYTWMRRTGYYVQWVSIISLGALVVSIVQQRILRTRINPAAQWMWASTIGWCAGWAVGLGIAHITPGSDWVKGAVGGAAGGVIVGAITGWALVRLLAGSSRGGEDSL